MKLTGKPYKTDPETGERHPLTEEEEAHGRHFLDFIDYFRALHGRNITQGEMDNALRASGLWDKGVRITVPYGRGQA